MQKIFVQRWKCDFCIKAYSSKKKMERHEKMCFSNPKRVCACGNSDSVNNPTENCNACTCYADWWHKKEYGYGIDE